MGDVTMQPEVNGFTTKEADDEVGVTYFGQRYLFQHLGRWTTPDPLHVHAVGGGEALNSYHYVSGNLLQARDPIGLDDEMAHISEAYMRALEEGPSAVYAKHTGAALERRNAQIAVAEAARDLLEDMAANQAGAENAAWLYNSVNTPNRPGIGDGLPIAYDAGEREWYSTVRPFSSQNSFAAQIYEDALSDRRWHHFVVNTSATFLMSSATEAGWARMSLRRVPGVPATSPWRLAPTRRGLVIEEMLGGNLAPGFPTIDRFVDGTATSIKSMDTTLRSYQNIDNVLDTVKGYIDDLIDFQGGRQLTSVVRGGEISARQLDLAVPRGRVSEVQRAALELMGEYAEANNVRMRVVEIE